MQVAAQPQQVIVDELLKDDDDELIQETRLIIFQKAIAKYACSLEQATGMIVEYKKVELKQRKGSNKMQSSAKDIVDLFLYYVNLMLEFPRDVIKCNGAYIDIFPQALVHQNNPVDTSSSTKVGGDVNKQNVDVDNDVHKKVDDAPDMDSLSRTELMSLLQKSMDDKDDLTRAMSNLRAHVLSIEKILYDELLGVRSIADRNTAAIKEIKRMPKAQPTPTAPSQQSQASTPPPGQKPATQAGSVPPAEQRSGTPMPGSRAAAAPVEDPTVSQLLGGDSDTDSSDSESNTSVYGDPTGDSDNDPTVFRGATKVNAATSPVFGVDASTSPSCVRFDSDGNQPSAPATSNNIKPPAGAMKAPRKRPMQKSVNDTHNEQNAGNWITVESKHDKKKLKVIIISSPV